MPAKESRLALRALTNDLTTGLGAVVPRWVHLLSGGAGVALCFLWGLAESTLFFVVPDVLLSVAAVFCGRRVWRHILAAVCGAVVGGALMFQWATVLPAQARSAVRRVPFVTQQMIAQVQADYQRHPIAAVFLGPLSGIPYKIYAVEAPPHLGMATFLIAAGPARAYRFVAVSILAALLAAGARRRWQPSAWQLAAIHAATWSVFYALYWARIALS